MLKRRFGKTEMDLSVLTFGAMRIIPEGSETQTQCTDRAFATLRRAIDVGINHIETARGYGQSEELIGRALKEGVIKREEFYLTTKIGPTETAQQFRSSLDDSMKRMGVDFVDNLDIHGINTMEIIKLSARKDGCIEASQQAISEGLVAHLGFSTHAPVEVILAALNTDLFSSINLHYYFVNPRNKPAVDLAVSKDMGVFIISPTDKGGQLFNPPPKLVELCNPWTPIQMNQRWLLTQPQVHTLSLGCAKPSEFDAHLDMANREQGALAPEEEAIFATLTEAMRGMGSTYCSFCHACLPCPEEVHIPEILRFRNLAKAYDMLEFGKYRYKMLSHRDPATGERIGGANHWFPGTDGSFCTDCGDCLPRCPLNLSIPQLLAESHEMFSGEVGKRLWAE